jgi:hypothetical protein
MTNPTYTEILTDPLNMRKINFTRKDPNRTIAVTPKPENQSLL